MFRDLTPLVALTAAMIVSILPASAQAPANATPPGAATEAPAAADVVLAENAQTRLTRADYEADLQRLQPQLREEFASDKKRLAAYLTNLLVVKTLAADARRDGVESEPQIQRRIALEVDRVLADGQLRHLEQVAGKDFDAKSAEFEVKAKEVYLVNKERFRVPEQIKASQILFDTRQRTPEEARALANETRKNLVAGADFAATAREVSDDPSAKANGGEVGWFARDRMEAALSNAAFEMKNAGDISEPILTRFGYHLIRFEGRRPAELKPFEAVEPQIMAELRKRYIDEQRDARTAAIQSDPNLKVDEAAIDSLVTHPDMRGFGTAPKRGSRADPAE